MSIIARIRKAANAFFEGAQHRPGRAYIPATFQSAWKDYTKSTRETLQKRSRYFARNNPIVNRAADLFETGVVGTGLLIDPSSSDSAWNEKRELFWRTWCNFADVASRQTFEILQGLIARAWFVDGECFIILTEDSTGARVQVIEADRVLTPPDRSKDEGVTVIDGIRIDPSNGRPIGYWVSTNEGNGKVSFRSYDSWEVIHVFEPERAGQYRGIPFITSVLNTLDDLDSFQKLEMKAAVGAATIMNVRTTSTGELDADDIVANGGTVTTSSGVTTATESSLGGDTIALAPNEKLEQFKSERPSVITREYWRYLTEMVCSGIGIPYVMLFPESMQGTVYRGALDSASVWFRSRFSVIADVVRRIYEWQTKIEVSRNPQLNPAPKDYLEVTVHPPRAPNVDVGYNSAATIAELAQGLTTYDAVYGPRGLSWRKQFKKLAEQRQFAAQLGILNNAQPTLANGPQ